MEDKINGKIPSFNSKDDLHWININEWEMNKNLLKYLDMKFKEQLIYGRSEINVEEFIYWNDEWNGQWIKDPKKETEIKEVGDKFQWINPVHWLFELYFMGKITKEELDIKLKSL